MLQRDIQFRFYQFYYKSNRVTLKSEKKITRISNQNVFIVIMIKLYLIDFQRITQMSNAFRSNFVIRQIQCFERLEKRLFD